MDEKEFKKLFGKRVKELRLLNNLTQEKVSELMWIDPQHFCKMENGNHFPTVKNLLKLSEIFNVDIKDLFSFDNLMENKTILQINADLKKLDNNELKYIRSITTSFMDLKKVVNA